MKRLIRNFVVTMTMFVIFGIALGILAYVAGTWAQTQLIADAGGQAAAFGPVFVSVTFLQTAIVILFFGPVVAGIVGSLLGSDLRSPTRALLTGGISSLLGFYLMAIVALGFLVFAKGPDAQQAFSLTHAIQPMLLAGVPTAVIGAVTSTLSAAIN